MKRSRNFILDGASGVKPSAPDFYGFEFFDHDLILFCDRGGRYRLDADDLTVIGGRSARPFKSEKLFEVLGLSKSDRSFFIDFLSDGEKDFSFFVAGGKLGFIYNRLFRSSGLGIAAVFDYSPRSAVSAIKHGLFDRLGERIYSPSLAEMMKETANDDERYSNLAYSVLMLADAMAELLDIKDVVSGVRTASRIIGCTVDTIGDGDPYGYGELDADSFVSIVLCQLSLCRRISVDRGGIVCIKGGRERVKISFEYEIVPTELVETDMECLQYCERLSLGHEMPFSVDVSGKSFFLEFIPYRVDPSLYGLKAGVRIVIDSKE